VRNPEKTGGLTAMEHPGDLYRTPLPCCLSGLGHGGLLNTGERLSAKVRLLSSLDSLYVEASPGLTKGQRRAYPRKEPPNLGWRHFFEITFLLVTTPILPPD